ncbi:MAG TPA: hypothetical protein VES01_00820 [Dermatophilaceae bacterium]|nr:hypothetical protein [Dermatophilaceae bacterium]
MTTAADAVRAIAAWPEVDDVIPHVRQACTELRWHQALRRRIPESAAESRVRGAAASAELDGARSAVEDVRDLMRGALDRATHTSPTELTVLAAVQSTAESEHVERLLGTSPAQALARLHVAAGALLLPPEQVGRPRSVDQPCLEFSEIDSGLTTPGAFEARLRALTELMAVRDAPALVVVALAHAEVVTMRPFLRGNGLVARGLERALLRATGLDPTGVVVPEVGHLQSGQTAYLGALLAYSSGSREGVSLWVRHCAQAIITGAQEGWRVADAVLVGRLS